MRGYLLLACLLVVNPAKAQVPAESCEPTVASDGLTFRTDPRTSANFGVEVARFVVPTGAPAVVHGVDVSKYQDAVDFEMLKTCGGDFAYVRLSAGVNPDSELRYRDLWKNARSVGFFVGGYHNLNLIEPKTSFKNLPADEQTKLVDDNVGRAKAQAQTFLTRLSEMRDLEVKGADDQGANVMLPPVLDLSWRPQARFGSAAMEAYGVGYREAVCAWIDSVRASRQFSIDHVVLFVTPQAYADMKLDELGCLKSDDGFWVSVHTRTGDGLTQADDKTAAILNRMCGSDGQNRCWFQQYTSFGKFALFGADVSMDLDRFFGSKDDLRKILIRTGER
jgi:GH25 family lysozyme M1 (1,4-beta-N-acetylmuramidase)